jgi:RND superfamily putative drug exporter
LPSCNVTRAAYQRFRSAGAPLAALACAGTAYLLAVRTVAWGAQRMGVSLPPDLEPVLVVLLLGVTTDYSVFFLDGMRGRLAEGAPGILSPTEILVIGPGVAGQTGALARLQHELAGQPGVAEAAGPASLPSETGQLNPMLARSGGGARFVLVEKTDPLDATAISRVRALQDDLPALGRSAGLAGARFEVAGQTALTGDAIRSIFADLGRVVLAIMLVTLVLLALFLRSALAPVYLLAASVLAVFAALGLTMLICQEILGFGSLVYFVPFAAGVLLVSLGSDYNVFVVGRIWEEARRRPVPDAVAVAAPQASRAITTAGVALAASFAMLAVIPLEQFRQTAIIMAVGVIIDAIAVRSLLVPALVALFGRLGMWPGHRVNVVRTAAGRRLAWRRARALWRSSPRRGKRDHGRRA